MLQFKIMKKSIIEEFKVLSKRTKKQNQKRFLAYILKYKLYLLLILVATGLLIFQASIVPKLTQELIDHWLPTSLDSPFTNEALRMIIGILSGIGALVFIKALGTFLSVFIVGKFQQNVEMDLKLDLYQKILRLNMNYFDKVNEGFFLSRMMRDTTVASEYARYIPEYLLNFIISFSMNFTFIFLYSWMIGTSTIFFLIILFGVAILLRFQFFKVWNNIRNQGDQFNQFLVNSFAGVREIKAYAWEKQEINNYQKIAAGYKKAWRGNFYMYGKWMSFNAIILGFLNVSIWALGSWQVIENNLTIGELTALSMYGVLVIEPINKLLSVFDIFLRGSVSLNRIFNILDENEEKYQGKELKITNGDIEFKNVHLSYGKDMHALRGIDFKIKGGERVAFVGSTGSGKSTILKSLASFYLPNKGKILIDNQDVSEIGVQSLRSNLTLMSQEPYIFFDSIKKNIVFGNEEIATKDYEKVKQNAQLEEFVISLPENDHTNIGPRGISLSGGQKQRVALARAFLKNAKIILFDEATSALDNTTEKLIKKQISYLTKNKTIIFVAHRLTTIQDVDRIYVLEKGKIVEVGNHKELLAKKGKYYELVQASNI